MTFRMHTAANFESAVRWLSAVLLAVGALGIGGWLYSELDARFYRRIYERQLDEALEPAVPIVPRPAASPLPPGVSTSKPPPATRRRQAPDPKLLGRLEIPRLGVQAAIRDGVDSATLRRAVGHVPGTALPGTPGNSVIAGHRDSLFQPLRHIERGDTIRVHLRGRLVEYTVDSLAVVAPDSVEVMGPAAGTRLTLITCFPFSYIGPAPRRLVIGAEAAPSP